MRKSYLSIDKLYNTSGDAGILSGKIQKFHKKKWALKKQYSRETFPLQNIKQNNFLYPIRLNYKTRLKAKQLVKYFYNNLSNRQLKKEFLLATENIKTLSQILCRWGTQHLSNSLIIHPRTFQPPVCICDPLDCKMVPKW